jgi:hypothetical protein
MEMFASSFPTEAAARESAKRADLTVRRCAFTKMVTGFCGKFPFAYLASDPEGSFDWIRCGTEMPEGWSLV